MNIGDVRTLVFLYARISEDPRDRRRGVKMQLEDLRQFAVGLNAEIGGEFVENDVSAHTGEERPEYDALMAAVIGASGQPGVRVVVAAYHPSRLWRRRVERAQAIEDLRRAKCFVAFESGGYFNLQKATDRSQLAQLGESDTQESEVKSERVARAALERAREGRANGPVAYGWRRVYEYDDRGQITGFHDVEHPDQAEVVREVVKRLLGGDALIGITADLNERGVPSPGTGQRRKHRTKGQDEDGSRWNKTSVKKVALREANIALRRHGEDTYPAEWPALIEDDQHARLKLMFASRSAADRTTRPGQRNHLLTWGDIAVCGVCGGWLRVAMRGNKRYGVKQETYCCDPKGCVGRNKAALDRFVRDLVIDRLSRPDASEVFEADGSEVVAAMERIAGLRSKQGGAAEDFAADRITRDQLVRITESLAKRINEAQAELRRVQPSMDLSVLDGLVGPQAAQRWDALTVVKQRRVLEVLRLRMAVHPVTRRGPGFDPESIKFPEGKPFAAR